MSETPNAGATAESAAGAVQTVTKPVEAGTSADSAFNSVDQAILNGSGTLTPESFGPQNPDARVEATMNTVSQMDSEDIHASLENVSELNDSSEHATEQPTPSGDFRQQMEAILDNNALSPEDRAAQIRALQQGDTAEQPAQPHADTATPETPLPAQQSAAEVGAPSQSGQESPAQSQQTENQSQTTTPVSTQQQQAEAPAPNQSTVTEAPATQTQPAAETLNAGQTQEAATPMQPVAETPTQSNDQLLAQTTEDTSTAEPTAIEKKGSEVQAKREERISELQAKVDNQTADYNDLRDLQKLQAQDPDPAKRFGELSERAKAGQLTDKETSEYFKLRSELRDAGETANLTTEQQARVEGIKLGNELTDIGVDPKSEAGQKLMIELAKDPSLMEKLKLVKEGMTQLAEALGPEVAQQTAEAATDALKKQQAEAEAKGDTKKASKLKSLLIIMLALIAGGAFAIGGAATVAIEKLGAQTK